MAHRALYALTARFAQSFRCGAGQVRIALPAPSVRLPGLDCPEEFTGEREAPWPSALWSARHIVKMAQGRQSVTVRIRRVKPTLLHLG